MSIFSRNAVLKIRLAADSERRKLDDKLSCLGLTAAVGRSVGGDAPHDASPEGGEEHPIEDEVEDKYNLSRVSEEEEIQRYFSPFQN